MVVEDRAAMASADGRDEHGHDERGGVFRLDPSDGVRSLRKHLPRPRAQSGVKQSYTKINNMSSQYILHKSNFALFINKHRGQGFSVRIVQCRVIGKQ